jgi:mono/diheme cytochrome c family protein
MDQGILLRFEVPLSPIQAANVANYQVERWNYQRRYTYGSLHYRLDGTVGQDRMGVASAYLSKDGKSVFLGVPDMKTGVMQMHVGWSLSAQDGETVRNDSFFTPYALSRFQPEIEGFGELAVNLKLAGAPAEATGAVADGARLYQALGCMACHSIDGSPRVGPTWKGLFGQTVALKNGSRGIVDEAFVRAHLRPHADQTVLGFEPGMPDYSGVVNDTQAAALVAYIRSLR